MAKRRLQIFLSYASEDQRFADTVADRLTSAFRNDVELKYMSKFQVGGNWRELIDQDLDNADILLVIATGQEKLSHSFTGYEVGYFRKSQQSRKYMDDAQRIERLIIPIAMLAEVPDTLSNIQGLAIAEADRFLFDHSVAGRSPSEDRDPFYKLLFRIDGIVNKLEPVERSGPEHVRIANEYRNEARLFYEALGQLMTSMPLHTEYPKTRLTLRLPADFNATDIDLERGAQLACRGPIEGIFPGPSEQWEQWVSWSEFSKRIGSDDIALTWNEALRSLVAETVAGDAAHSDQLVFSFDQRRLFHLFVSKSTTFFDRTRELGIIVVEVSREKGVGDPFTTYLAEAIAIAMRYRALFLEASSPYGPVIVRFSAREQWKPTIKQVLRELRLLLMRSREAGIGDRRHVIELFGADEEAGQIVLEMLSRWRDLKAELFHAGEAVLAESEPTEATFDRFLNTLNDFCAQTKEMNYKFATAVLQRLEGVLKEG